LISVPKSKYDDVVSFYLESLAPLGYVEIKRLETVIGIGADGVPDFWI
jgi:hypothetical protein